MRLIAIVRLTVHETARKRVLHATLLCGLAFLALYAVGYHYVIKDISRGTGPMELVQRRFVTSMFTMAGLYAVNFLMAMSAVLLPVDTLAGEIASGVMQTMAARPVHRSEIMLGKWLGHLLVVWAYLLLIAGGVFAVAYFTAGYMPPGIAAGLALMALEAMVLVSLSIAGGARFGTVTNGVLAFGLYGLAFLGGLVEQVGALTHNDATRNIGTVVSLIMPSQAMWQLAAHLLEPPFVSQLHMSPFSAATVPSAAMVVWAAVWALGVLGLGLRTFSKRAL